MAVNTEHIHEERMKEMACEVFRVVENITPTLIQKLLLLKCSHYTLKKGKTAVVPKANTSKCGSKSFVHEPRIWNILPDELRKIVNDNEFRKLIRNRDVPSRNCSVCR